MRLIDADALADLAFERFCKDCDKRKGIKNGKYRIVYMVGEAPCRSCEISDMTEMVDDAPTVDAVERKKGKWIKISMTDDGYSITLRCSCCKENDVKYPWKYCPNCGAEMECFGKTDATSGNKSEK